MSQESPIVGATVNLTGDAEGSTLTGADGSYSFAGLSDGSYTVTPSLVGLNPVPDSAGISISGGSSEGNNFSGVKSLSLPYYRTFDGQSELSLSYSDAQWSLVNQSYPSEITINVNPSLNSYNPSSLGYTMGLKHGPSTSRYKETDYLLPGIVDASQGFRFGVMCGQVSEWFHFGMGLYSVDENQGIIDGVRSYYQRNPYFWAWTYTGGVSTNYYSWVSGGGAFNPDYPNSWYALYMEFPANGNGTLYNICKTISSGPTVQTRTKTQAINVDVSGWSPLTTFRIQSQPRYDSGYYFYPFFWVGSLTDDWPV